MEQKLFLKYVTCPITNLIFRDPVIAEDGKTYEYMAIRSHLTKSNISPTTLERMGSSLLRSVCTKTMVNEFLNNNPEFRDIQFLNKKPFYLFSKDFFDLLKNKSYDHLKDFTNIILNTEIGSETLFELVCKTCPIDITINIIDNSIDYDVYDRKKLKPLHIACKYAPKEIIMHLIGKGVDINSEDMNGETPLSYIVLNRKKEEYDIILKDFLEFDVDVNKINKNGYMAVHYIISNGDLHNLQLFIKRGLNISTLNQKLGGLNLLQYSFREANSQDIIKYIIDLNVSLDVDVDPKTSCEQLIYLNQTLNKKQRQELVLYYLTKILSKAVVDVDFIDTVPVEKK